jgi:DNA-binding transcriptional ArsR family regulator
MTVELTRAVDRIRADGLDAAHAAALSATLGLMSEPTRLRILYALDLAGEVCVGDLAVGLEIPDDSATYALRLLRTAGLVTSRKAGRTVYYRLAPDFPEPLLHHCWTRLVDLAEGGSR